MKTDKITTKIGNETVQVVYGIAVLNDRWMTLVVDTMQDALILAFAHRFAVATKIETLASGAFGVIVYKDHGFALAAGIFGQTKSAV